LTMADSVIEPETNDIDSSHAGEQELHNDPPGEDGGTVSVSNEQMQTATEPAGATPITSVIGDEPPLPIIWTPGFIGTFTLIFIIGMSLNSVLAQDWIDGGNNEFWILIAHVILVLGGWVAAIVMLRSRWARLGSIFGCAWAAFTALNLTAGYLHVFQTFDIRASLNALISCLLLGLSICLSIDRTLLRRWDTWFFRLAIPAGIGIAVIPFVVILGAGATSPLGALESDIAASVVILSLTIWWLRPSCWKTQPGPALLFGLVPAFLLYLAIPGAANRATNIYFMETLYLCMFLGILRVIQGDIRCRQADLRKRQSP